MTTLADRISGLRLKIATAREVEARSTDKGLAANLRLYIAELELELQQLEAQHRGGATR
jgi:hypothetical protein